MEIPVVTCNIWIVTIDDQIIGTCTVYTNTNAGNTLMFQNEVQGHDNANIEQNGKGQN